MNQDGTLSVGRPCLLVPEQFRVKTNFVPAQFVPGQVLIRTLNGPQYFVDQYCLINVVYYYQIVFYQQLGSKYNCICNLQIARA